MNQGIKDLVISVLPSLSDETLAHLLEVLEELGVENKEDLMLVEEKDIEKYLRPIQCRTFWLLLKMKVNLHGRVQWTRSQLTNKQTRLRV